MFRHVYRLPAYYVTVLLFGLFGLELCTLGVLSGWLPRTGRTERFFQRLIHRHFVVFHAWCDAVGLVHVNYAGLERLPAGGLVLAANHPSLIDITCLLARLPEAVCIFKPAIRRNPVLGAAARCAGYLGNDGGHELIRAAADKVAAGHTLVVFPEGTRTPPGQQLLPLKAGFVLIAQRAGVPIHLIHVATDSNLLAKGRAWWRPPILPAHVTVTAGPLLASDTASAAELTATIETWFRAAAVSGPAASCPPAAPSDRPAAS